MTCPYNAQDDECCGGFCGMDSEDCPPKTYTEAEVQAMVADALEGAVNAARKGIAQYLLEDFDTPPEAYIDEAIRALIPADYAAALAARDARIRREAMDSVTTLHNVISMIREKSGLGAGPMLADLPDAISEAITAARREERDRAAGLLDIDEACVDDAVKFWARNRAAAIRAGKVTP
jgi:hypothetical protein